MDNWFEEMEQAEQEYDNLEYEKNLTYQQGRVENMNNVKRRIDSLLDLERSITHMIHEEIGWNLKGEQSDIKDRISYILDEKNIYAINPITEYIKENKK